ncbi:hypothetical protein PHYBOEH_005917 [Phytophthora boehmeriae]|uniref:tetraacyldisaccharide 4'-kinase n=1 Tax=Phytophthora boehmeriae TaxID=109152 RepID=A0A8T1WJB6_9STRA|nr:hypothetical protein PHYBOEH_005917 [Phytophthora boehmeriae]
MAAFWRKWRRQWHSAVVSSLRSSDSPVDALIARQQPVLSKLYGWIVAQKRLKASRSPQRIAPPSVPVFSVGNITFGATGKTPFVLLLVDYAMKRQRNQVPLLLSRGYGDDEWRLLASRYPKCQMALGADRVAVGRAKVEELGEAAPLSCVVVDDGLQQWRLAKDLEIVMVDALHPLGNGLLLPCGSLRELPTDALKRAHVVIVHHADMLESEKLRVLVESLKNLMDIRHNPIIATSRMKVVDLKPAAHLQAVRTLNVVRNVTEVDGSTLNGRVALVLCGVGNPESVKLVVENLANWTGVHVKAFPDHHAFSQGDVHDVIKCAQDLTLHDASDVVVVTTEKDFARSPRAMKALTAHLDLRVLQCELEMLDNAFQLNQRIDSHLDRSFAE